MLTVNGALYKDVNGQDFNHYFSSTAMAWKLSQTKRRLFLVSQVEGPNITGTYLTREKEFKNKQLPFVSWWNHLDAITTQPLMFNLPGGAALWYQKVNKNLKKSFPWQVNHVTFFGAVDAHHKTMQFVAHEAFQELYGTKPIFPTLPEAMERADSALVTREGFLVDRKTGKLWYKTQQIGTVEGHELQITQSKSVLVSLLKAYGVAGERITLIPNPLEPIQDQQGAIPMKLNNEWVEGYEPMTFPQRGYSVVKYVPGEPQQYRTYNGYYPGPALLTAGWNAHNYWGQ